MNETFRKILLVITIVIGLSAFIILFKYSISDDNYIHVLKDSYINLLSNSEPRLVGFKGNFVSSSKTITSTYQNHSVIYNKLEYKEKICSGTGTNRRCSWNTYDTKINNTEFELNFNNELISINDIKNIEYITNSDYVKHLSSNKIIVQTIIRTDTPIYVWGYLKDNELRFYRDDKSNKNIFIITDDPKKTLNVKIIQVLEKQFYAIIILSIMFLILIKLTKNFEEKEYIALTYSGRAKTAKQIIKERKKEKK